MGRGKKWPKRAYVTARKNDGGVAWRCMLRVKNQPGHFLCLTGVSISAVFVPACWLLSYWYPLFAVAVVLVTALICCRFVATKWCCLCCGCCCRWLIVFLNPLALLFTVTADRTIANTAVTASVSAACYCFVALLQVTAAVFVTTACCCYFVASHQLTVAFVAAVVDYCLCWCCSWLLPLLPPQLVVAALVAGWLFPFKYYPFGSYICCHHWQHYCQHGHHCFCQCRLLFHFYKLVLLFLSWPLAIVIFVTGHQLTDALLPLWCIVSFVAAAVDCCLCCRCCCRWLIIHLLCCFAFAVPTHCEVVHRAVTVGFETFCLAVAATLPPLPLPSVDSCCQGKNHSSTMVDATL